MAKKITPSKTIETLKHDEAKRKNIPTAEHESVIRQEEKNPIKIKYPRNTDLDPQLVWRGKDEQDWSDLVVNAPPLYIQEKVHPKALIDDLIKQTKEGEHDAGMITADLFSDFDGLPKDIDKTEFYSHDQNWSNRMILGDSLQVMASLAEREGLRGQVQCIYFDPPYGIKFNSNFQWSTNNRNVADGKADHITREPEQVKAFRDTWKDGIHSYMTYLRDRLTVARDLLSESGSIFLQIGDENVHRVRALMEEVFGEENFIATLIFQTTSSSSSKFIDGVNDYIIWFGKNSEDTKYRQLTLGKEGLVSTGQQYRHGRLDDGTFISNSHKDYDASRVFRISEITSQTQAATTLYEYEFEGEIFKTGKRQWSTPMTGMDRLVKARRVIKTGKTIGYARFFDDYPVVPIRNIWTDTGTGSGLNKVYVVQTNEKVVQRCILMSTDPGDLVLDPTCGSGTAAVVAEQWGRRWITMDTSRVALALARARVMGARYPYYLLADSREGQMKEAELSRSAPSTRPVQSNITHGFVCERVPHITLKSIANNQEIDVIWEKYKALLDDQLSQLNNSLGKNWMEWDVPRESQKDWSKDTLSLHTQYWKTRVTRQKEIDDSIVAKADFEYLYDKPYEDNKKVRVAGPFTVESLSPHRTLGVDENDNLIDQLRNESDIPKQSFVQMILDNLKIAGVQQAHKADKINFNSVNPWPGDLVCAEGRYLDVTNISDTEKRAAIFIGPEFGTVQRADLVQAAREAGDAGFDVLIACAFNYEAHASELNKLGSIPILKARMNADLHMAEDLKNTGKGNLFVIFGEPDIEIINLPEDKIRVKINGVDVFKPQTGEVVSDGADGIACWFIDTDYDEESFFVRQAYFLGANDPYSALKTTLKSEINESAWSSLNSDISRSFAKPSSGRIAVKVINHLGDEVMKVFRL
jgi:adenine-specific DNA-methyltransferase